MGAAVTIGITAILGTRSCEAPQHDDSPNTLQAIDAPFTATPVRTDHEPLRKRFPRLGNFLEAHWHGRTAGTGDSRVPGPSDILIQALVTLHPADLATAKTHYDWQPAPPTWNQNMSEQLRALAPQTGDWQHAPDFETDVRTNRYHGIVYLDLTSGIVYLDVTSY